MSPRSTTPPTLRTLLCVAPLAVLVAAAELGGQVTPRADTPRVSGMYVALALNMSEVDFKVGTPFTAGDPESGSGLGVTLAYGLPLGFFPFVEASAARMTQPNGSPYTLRQLDAGLRFRAGTPLPRLRLVVDAQLCARSIDGRPVSFDCNGGPPPCAVITTPLTGTIVTLGGGAEYHLTPSLTLMGATKYASGSLRPERSDTEHATYEIDETRFIFGIGWFPRR